MIGPADRLLLDRDAYKRDRYYRHVDHLREIVGGLIGANLALVVFLGDGRAHGWGFVLAVATAAIIGAAIPGFPQGTSD